VIDERQSSNPATCHLVQQQSTTHLIVSNHLQTFQLTLHTGTFITVTTSEILKTPIDHTLHVDVDDVGERSEHIGANRLQYDQCHVIIECELLQRSSSLQSELLVRRR
jgi:hypothetical protein